MDLNTTMGGKTIVYAFSQIIILLLVFPAVAGEYCQYGYSTYSSYGSTYCYNGCCGTKYSDYSDVCCDSGLSSGAIAGIVIASLAVPCLVIGSIICCCVAANNSSRRIGTVIQPGHTGVQTVVVNSTAFSQGQSAFSGQHGAVGYGYTMGIQPPPYTQHNTVSQGSANTAYPPPPPPAKY